GGGGSVEIIFHVGRCEINNGQTRFDFPKVPVGPATHCVRLGKARERDLLAAAELCSPVRAAIVLRFTLCCRGFITADELRLMELISAGTCYIINRTYVCDIYTCIDSTITRAIA
ncbi:hypothetical protein ALC56_03064, partial [Trachymyrmex septentrionalis]